MTDHKQVYVKVNAPCDEGIAPLVIALNEIRGVVTLDSCEDGAWGAYVFFTYGDKWQDLAALLQEISTGLSTLGLPVGFSLNMEWLGSNDRPRAQISLEPEHVALVAEPLRGLASTLNAHMTVALPLSLEQPRESPAPGVSTQVLTSHSGLGCQARRSWL